MEFLGLAAGYVEFAFEGFYLRLVRTWRRDFAVVGLIGIAVMVLGTLYLAPPGFPRNAVIEVSEEASFAQTAAMLEERHIIWNARFFKALARITGTDRDVQAGNYVFSESTGTGIVLYRLANGISGIPTTRVTFPEGYASFDMARVLAEKLPGFDGDLFKALGEEQWEGYLFPDTYDFLASTTPQEAIDRMLANYEEKRASFADDLATATHTEHEIITMASIVEREAATPEDRRIVAGILWKRMTVGMRLQVDAPFAYANENWSYTPTQNDLDEDTPYNTYRNDGLPPIAIGNPGLDAIEATLHPTETPYLYYLTGTDGLMHYAQDFEGHKKNKELYLN